MMPLSLGYAFNDLNGAGGGAADIGQRFQLCGTVDVTHYDVIRIFSLNLRKTGGGQESTREQPAFKSGSNTF